MKVLLEYIQQYVYSHPEEYWRWLKENGGDTNG